MSCASAAKPSSDLPIRQFYAARLGAQVNGESVVLLSATVVDPTQPQITSVSLLPGRGMNVFQVQGYLPGRGLVNLLFSQELQPGENSLGAPHDDFNGNLAFSKGGALLVPYANRVRGKLSADEKTLVTQINGKSIHLPANWKGKLPHAEKNAMHGLILGSKIPDVKLDQTSDQARAHGTLDAGDFSGHWPSRTQLEFDVALQANLLTIAVTAKNTGQEDLPMGIGWHPYFAFPSGNRQQARLRIPAKTRLLVNNYDDVFPLGKYEAVEGSAYDFNSPQGKALGSLYMDDCFVDLPKGTDGQTQAEIIDPAAHYGMRVTALSPEMSAFQVYAPIDKSFVALEPQFNWADPYNEKIWKHGEKTGMVVLKPGQSTVYKVQLQLFTPGL